MSAMATAAATVSKSPSFSEKPTVRVTQDQIDFFHREGYLALPVLTTQQEVEWLKGIYDRLFEQRAGRERGDHFDLGGTDEEGKQAVLPQILNPMKYAPELERTLCRTNATGIARQIFGDDVIYEFDHAINKPARIGAATPWHQDEAYSLEDEDYVSINVWIPLQPVDMANGCMQFVPRSHKMAEVLPHRPIGNDPRVHGLECDPSPQMRASAVPCPLPAGGVTLHHSRTLHYAGPNNSDNPRRAYILNFHTPRKKRAVPKNFFWNKLRQTPRDERAKAAGGFVAKKD